MTTVTWCLVSPAGVITVLTLSLSRRPSQAGTWTLQWHCPADQCPVSGVSGGVFCQNSVITWVIIISVCQLSRTHSRSTGLPQDPDNLYMPRAWGWCRPGVCCNTWGMYWNIIKNTRPKRRKINGVFGWQSIKMRLRNLTLWILDKMLNYFLIKRHLFLSTTIWIYSKISPRGNAATMGSGGHSTLTVASVLRRRKNSPVSCNVVMYSELNTRRNLF